MDKEKTIFAYSWHQTDDESKNWRNSSESLRIYGINDKGKTLCLIVNDFKPFVHIELPSTIDWKSKVQKVVNYLKFILGDMGPVKNRSVFEFKYKLYGSHVTKTSPGKFQRKKFPYIILYFDSRKHIFSLISKLKNPVNIPEIGNIKLNVRETNISPILQLCVERNLPSCGWIGFKTNEAELMTEEEKFTDCEEEYKISKNNIYAVEKQNLASAKIMAWDIEAYSEDGSFPDGIIPGNVVFQISCVFFIVGNPERKKYLLSLGDPVKWDNETIIRKFKTEEDLLRGFSLLQKEEQPHLTTGWNTFQFDIDFLLKRAKLHKCLPNFLVQGFPKEQLCKEKVVKWQSKAYGTTNIKFLDCEGVLSIDLMDVVQKEHKLDKYSLNAVAKHFLDSSKDDLDHVEIFRCYSCELVNPGSEEAKIALSKVGKYCVQDSVLVADLFEFLQTWLSLTEMSKTCTTPVMTIHVHGQQVKFFNQLYKYCYDNRIVVDKESYTVNENERYRGAEVLDPVPGLKRYIVPLDFASLYPSIIMAKNLDYSTFVEDDEIPDDMCHVLEWEDHVSCEHDPNIQRKMAITKELDRLKDIVKSRKEHNKVVERIGKIEIWLKSAKNERRLKLESELRDIRLTLRNSHESIEIDDLKKQISELSCERANITKKISKNSMCAKRRYRFLKEPKGILPTIIKNLLEARKKTREEMKELKKRGEEDLWKILDKRQNSYKITANSMYGATGVRVGSLPFIPVAMCTTYFGRKSILEVSEYLKQLGGKVVYGDTDCLLHSTPVLIRHGERMFFSTVEDLSEGDWEYINPNKDISSPKDGFEIWSDQGFTKIENVVRCKVEESLSRVTTHNGSVICSNNHSLLTECLTNVTPLDIGIGDKLCSTEFPLPADTPKSPLYPNKLTAEKIREYEISDFECTIHEETISAKIAFVWGLFFADGSAGVYKAGENLQYLKYSWTINKSDIVLLERAQTLLEETSGDSFKILNTLESSKVYKLVPSPPSQKLDKDRVNKYISMFYHGKNKCIPAIILQSPFEIRQSFFMGYYAGDGSKKDPAISLSNKGQIGTAQLFYLMKSLGYRVSVNVREDKPEIYKLTGSTPLRKERKVANAIKKIAPFKNENGYIYDIQTENHHFAAGVGQLVVHNSNYVSFDGIVDPNLRVEDKEFVSEMKKLWDHAIFVAKEISKKFPDPITLEFENAIYFKFLILTKKRYMYYSCGEDGAVSVDKAGTPKMGKRGVILSRRDNCKFMRDVYKEVIDMIFDERGKEEVFSVVIERVLDLFTKKVENSGEAERNCETYLKDLIVTKSVGDYGDGTFQPILGKNEKGEERWRIGNYVVPLIPEEIKKTEGFNGEMTENEIQNWYLEHLPGQVQLEMKIKKRGHAKEEGQRLSYVVTDIGYKGKQSEKIEAANYFANHSSVLKLDYGYYIERLVEPLDQVFKAVYGSNKKFRGVGKDYSENFKRTKLFTMFQKAQNQRDEGFTKNLHKLCASIKPKVLNELKSFSKPTLEFCTSM